MHGAAMTLHRLKSVAKADRLKPVPETGGPLNLGAILRSLYEVTLTERFANAHRNRDALGCQLRIVRRSDLWVRLMATFTTWVEVDVMPMSR